MSFPHPSLHCHSRSQPSHLLFRLLQFPSVWPPAKTLHKIQLVQNSAVHIITCSPYIHHITPILKQLHWLPITYSIDYKILLLTFKAFIISPSISFWPPPYCHTCSLSQILFLHPSHFSACSPYYSLLWGAELSAAVLPSSGTQSLLTFVTSTLSHNLNLNSKPICLE